MFSSRLYDELNWGLAIHDSTESYELFMFMVILEVYQGEDVGHILERTIPRGHQRIIMSGLGNLRHCHSHDSYISQSAVH